MSFHRFLTGSDERLEAEWLASRVFPGVRLAHRKLANGKAKKGEADIALVGD
jgi:hypothetical protein